MPEDMPLGVLYEAALGLHARMDQEGNGLPHEAAHVEHFRVGRGT